MTKLKPCPFCGCEDIGTGFEICRRVYFCNDCGVSVTAVDGDDGKVWNTRPGEDAAVRAERERCAGIAENGSFPFDISVWLESTKKEMTALTLTLIDQAIDKATGR